jgi:hypothetical protein
MTTRSLRPSRPLITVERVVAALLILIAFGVVALLALAATIAFYILFVVATILVVRSVAVEPGAWLGLRTVRRGLVVVITLITLDFATVGPLGFASVGLVLFVLLALGDLALGRATRRIASADEDRIDERQEALRNRAHRIAYAILAISMTLVLLVAETADQGIRLGIAGALNGGLVVSFIQLLFFLPAMIIAWIEPDRIADDDPSRIRGNVRARIAYAMVAIAILLPAALSLSVAVAPVRTTAFTKPEPAYVAPDGTGTTQCTYFSARKQVGIGLGATIPITAVACWNGNAAFEEWGLNDSDCYPASTSLVTLTTLECRRSTGPDGSLHFTYRALLRSPLLPFVSREVDMTLNLTKDGKVVQFP